MSLFKKIATLSLVLTASLIANASTVEEAAKKYKEFGLQVVDLVNTNNIDVNKIEELVVKQTEYSVTLVQQYQKKYPSGTKLLDIALNQVATFNDGIFSGLGPLKETKFSIIEAEWHDLGFTTSMDVGIDMGNEDNEHFTDPLHVSLHPIMALRAAIEYTESGDNEMKEAIKAETMEGIEQVQNVLELLEDY